MLYQLRVNSAQSQNARGEDSRTSRLHGIVYDLEVNLRTIAGRVDAVCRHPRPFSPFRERDEMRKVRS